MTRVLQESQLDTLQAIECGRTTVAQIARGVGRSDRAVQGRLERLEDHGMVEVDSTFWDRWALTELGRKTLKGYRS